MYTQFIELLFHSLTLDLPFVTHGLTSLFQQEAKTEAAEEKVHEIEKELIKRSEKEDALNFNIQRLTKRVETLQEELNVF